MDRTQVPRLTSVLRVCLTDYGSKYDVQEEQLNLRNMLKRRAAQKKAGAASTSSLPSAGTESIYMEKEYGAGIDVSLPPLEDAQSDEEVPITPVYFATREDTPSIQKVEQNEPSQTIGMGPLDEFILRCEDHTSRKSQSADGSISHAELAASVLDILNTSTDESVLQSSLFDLLGVENFDFISWILASSQQLVKAASKRSSAALVSRTQTRNTQQQSQQRPTYGAQVTVQSESDKLLQKMRRKEEKKATKKGKDDVSDRTDWLQEAFDPVALREQREAALANPMSLEQIPVYGGGGDRGAVGWSQKVALPEGTFRRLFKGYEEVHIPPTIPGPMGKTERLIPISEFDDWARPAFKGTRSLNRIQSRLFEAAYRSNENILVCAPTGAGKTNIAMMAVLHEIGLHMRGGMLQRDEFKIVYVAPMKALAAEVVSKFSEKLAALSIVVKELTGDMQLTKKELTETQMIVTTPEKWDVITRKTSDVALTQMVRLLIIDEVHLLNDDRGPVIETIVARTLRQVETSQSMIRIVGLSATLPNYKDVAIFLRVNVETGLYYFDNSYRPVPLSQQYIGISESNAMRRKQVMDELCYEKVMENLRQGHQVMVFVHSRKDTGKTARTIREMAQKESQLGRLMPEDNISHLNKECTKTRSAELKDLIQSGLGIHNAGMLRSDRNLVERLFSDGYLKVLCCTATLAWGVNLPAHTVIIKGTQVYDAQKGSFTELSMLDVMQIFGRAGRPQYDTSGEGIILTSHDKLSHYLNLINHQLPIESQFIKHLADNMNAEIMLGTVSNVGEAVEWLSYTYLFVRMMRNPMVYGISYEDKEIDPLLQIRRSKLIEEAAKTLHNCKMIRFVQHSGSFLTTDLGRVASHFYIEHGTIEVFNELLKEHMSWYEIFNCVASAHEFANVQTREEEVPDLERLLDDACYIPVKNQIDNQHAKTNILMQSYISRANLENFTLITDCAYIVQNAGRIARGLFEIALRKGWVSITDMLLTFGKMLDRRMWYAKDYTLQSPLRQFGEMTPEIIMKLEDRKATIDRLRDMTDSEIGSMIHHPRAGAQIKKCLDLFPTVSLTATLQPITRTVLRVQLIVKPEFKWLDRLHGAVEPWWIWMEDSDNRSIYYSEYLMLYRKNKGESMTLDFTIPISDPIPPQYFVRAVSDRWIGAETMLAVNLESLILPEKLPPHTELLDLQPLPVTVLRDPKYQALYRFTHFNPIQTQVLHTLYHTDSNVLLGAPTGSGKTIVAELAMFRVFNEYPSQKIVYIGPLKALVRERMEDWKIRMVQMLGKKLVELTGDYTPDIRSLQGADIVCTTPEKWDGISRNWQNRSYVTKVALMVIDEIHLLGGDRGPILEVIVSRMRYISSQTAKPIRFVGLSTALANAKDLADWLSIDHTGLFNFKPAVRPVPIEAHVLGFPGQHYCPRMATMNKPTYNAILQYSPTKPALVFVSSRRQTRLTALDLIAYCATEESSRKFLRMSFEELEMALVQIQDSNLKHTLSFGIGLHHAGLGERDKQIVEDLFLREKIQVLVSTSTLAWGVNLPAHLVVIKGTEFYDAKTKRYVDFPITDVLQMMGRAGRPQFDDHGVAVILVHEPKKSFYKKFIYEPFPVESSLPNVLHDHINAEIVAGTIASKQDAIDYLTWTYFFRRLVMNPSYYHLDDTSYDGVNKFLSNIVENTLQDLQSAQCVEISDDVENAGRLEPMTSGRIASFYYLSYKTLQLFADKISDESCDLPVLLQILSDAREYDELPVRHNEDRLNAQLRQMVPWHVDAKALDSPHVKANLLLQAHFSRTPLPIADYTTDTRSVLDQSIRIIQAMVDVAADSGWLETTLQIMHLSQMIVQGRWFHDPSLMTLPHIEKDVAAALAKKGIECLPQLMSMNRQDATNALRSINKLQDEHVQEIINLTQKLPSIDVAWHLARDDYQEDDVAELTIELKRVNKSSLKLHTSKFPKTKEEGWWLVLGITNPNEEHELLALKRVSIRETGTTASLMWDVSESTRAVTLFLMSDSYLGLDQQYEIRL